MQCKKFEGFCHYWLRENGDHFQHHLWKYFFLKTSKNYKVRELTSISEVTLFFIFLLYHGTVREVVCEILTWHTACNLYGIFIFQPISKIQEIIYLLMYNNLRLSHCGKTQHYLILFIINNVNINGVAIWNNIFLESSDKDSLCYLSMILKLKNKLICFQIEYPVFLLNVKFVLFCRFKNIYWNSFFPLRINDKFSKLNAKIFRLWK